MVAFILSNEKGKFKMSIWTISRPRVDNGDLEPLHKQKMYLFITLEHIFLQHHHMCKQIWQIFQVIYIVFK